jgi:peptidoglycan/xylan/chitin deacetylase (PgdA/CDA1 family)
MERFRADRLATLYVFHPLQSLRPRKWRIPILMYHSVSEAARSTRHAYFHTNTSPKAFEEQLKFLYERQYQVRNLGDAMGAALNPRRATVITFDDGFRDFYTHAFPLLSRYRYTATVFLPTAYIGDWAHRSFNGTECMTWSQVRELQEAGIQFGSHTVTHPQLRALSTKDVEGEIRRSKETIEDKLGCPIRSFAYPYAFPETDWSFKRNLESILEQAGYENGVCTRIGTADRSDNRFFLKRLPVNSCDDATLFKAKLEGGYDWLHGLQYAAKLPSAMVSGPKKRS